MKSFTGIGYDSCPFVFFNYFFIGRSISILVVYNVWCKFHPLIGRDSLLFCCGNLNTVSVFLSIFRYSTAVLFQILLGSMLRVRPCRNSFEFVFCNRINSKVVLIYRLFQQFFKCSFLFFRFETYHYFARSRMKSFHLFTHLASICWCAVGFNFKIVFKYRFIAGRLKALFVFNYYHLG